MTDPVVVAGGGAAGMMSALTARRQGAEVTLLERNPKVGRKLYLTGKGRCNLTNHCETAEFLRHIPGNSRFLYSALSAFPPSAAEDFFQDLGVPLKVERGGRVFPVSDKASDVVDALYFALRRTGVKLCQVRVDALERKRERITAVAAGGRRFPCSQLILATGGCSYPATGSTGDGYALAAALGHTVVPPRPSLVPLEAPDCAPLQGLSLRNVTLTVKDAGGKTLFQEQGELLFTHFGLSGPLVLSASAHLRQWDGERRAAHIDLKPALTPQQLEARLLRDREEYGSRDMGNYASALLPRSLIPLVLERSGIPAHRKVNALLREERRALVATLKDLVFPILRPRPLEEAIVTAGGVDVREVDPKTMRSKRVENLYFAGELLDVDGCTGGFNLHIAWATGRAAGLAAAQAWKER